MNVETPKRIQIARQKECPNIGPPFVLPNNNGEKMICNFLVLYTYISGGK